MPLVNGNELSYNDIAIQRPCNDIFMQQHRAFNGAYEPNANEPVVGELCSVLVIPSTVLVFSSRTVLVYPRRSYNEYIGTNSFTYIGTIPSGVTFSVPFVLRTSKVPRRAVLVQAIHAGVPLTILASRFFGNCTGCS